MGSGQIDGSIREECASLKVPLDRFEFLSDPSCNLEVPGSKLQFGKQLPGHVLLRDANLREPLRLRHRPMRRVITIMVMIMIIECMNESMKLEMVRSLVGQRSRLDAALLLLATNKERATLQLSRGDSTKQRERERIDIRESRQ